MTRGPSPSSLRRARKRAASASAIRIPPRFHIRGLDEKICKEFAPKPCAISSDVLISPAMDVLMPMRILPSVHAGISGGGGASGRYSSAASKASVLLWFSSAIPSGCPGALRVDVRAALQGASRAHAETFILAESAPLRKHSSTDAVAAFAATTGKKNSLASQIGS